MAGQVYKIWKWATAPAFTYGIRATPRSGGRAVAGSQPCRCCVSQRRSEAGGGGHTASWLEQLIWSGSSPLLRSTASAGVGPRCKPSAPPVEHSTQGPKPLGEKETNITPKYDGITLAIALPLLLTTNFCLQTCIWLTVWANDASGELRSCSFAADDRMMLTVGQSHLISFTLHSAQNHLRHITAVPVPCFLYTVESSSVDEWM